ncbi:MAG: hypothetical protein ABSB24_16635 [Gaiellaceae bacterium]|jgi:hypothetical protein
MTDLEALVVAAYVFADDYIGLVERVLPGWFPHLPDQSQFSPFIQTAGCPLSSASLAVGDCREQRVASG